MTPPATLKKKRRKMKQMQGLLLLARPHHQSAPHHATSTRVVFAPAKKVLVVLQPQQLQLAYSAQDDQDMTHILGRINLRGAQLEQLPDGFVIHESGASGKKFKLQDRDQATTDAWFFGVYAAITEFVRLPIPAREDHARTFSAVLTASLVDEVTDELEVELSCQLLLPARPIEKPSVRWKTWKTFAQLQAFDDDLRSLYGASMKKLLFPRERKRDALFGGLRRKHKQELKEQQLAQYIEKVFELPGVAGESMFLSKVAAFLGFDSFFEIKHDAAEQERSGLSETFLTQHESGANDNEAAPVPESPEASGYSAPLSSQGEALTYDHESRCSSMQSVDSLPPLSRSGSQFDDVGTEYVEIVPETDPKAAKKLHKSILQRVRELVGHDDDRVREFQEQTRYFGTNEISTTEYCAFLLGAFGSKECCQLIPMMARLLPNDDRRNELMDGRSAIWRRTIRRNRRRSKQFSESVAFQQQRNEVVHEAVVHKMRPKSDSMTALQWYQDRDAAAPVSTSRHSMIETPSAATFAPQSTSSSGSGDSRTGTPGNQESGIDTAPPPAYKKSLLDPRRKLQHRASFNHHFSDSIADPIQEEAPTSFDSDDDNQTSSEYLRRDSTVSSTAAPRASASTGSRGGWPALERKSSLAGATWTRPSERHFEDDDGAGDGAVDYRLRRSSLKTELESAPVPAEEENPVLARLKKQGAVNFMMR